MKTSFTKTCPKCNTIVSITEVGEKYPAKTYEHYYCPVCGDSLVQKNTMYLLMNQ